MTDDIVTRLRKQVAATFLLEADYRRGRHIDDPWINSLVGALVEMRGDTQP